MQTLLQDIRFSLRQLFKSPGFSLTAVLSLALGIGATTAVFSVVYAILMNPYPYAASDRMIHMRLLDDSQQPRGFGLTGAQWQQIRKSPVVEDAFMEDDWSLTVTGKDLPEDVQGVYFSSNGFTFMGVPPALGRGLIPSDAIDGQEPQPVVVLSYKFWQRHFNGDSSVLGQNLQLVRKNYTIVGVAGPRFTWGDGDVYLPQKVTQDPVKAFYVGVRLKPGVTHEAANAALQPLIQQFAKETPKHFPSDHFRLSVVGLNEQFVHDLGGTLYLLFSAVALLLAIGCGNVSILLLARGTARQHEFAVRTAIGASRGRIIRQLLTESLLLSLTGAALGVLLAYRALALIVELLPKYSFPHEAAIRINLPVLAFTVLVALGTGILFGLGRHCNWREPTGPRRCRRHRGEWPAASRTAHAQWADCGADCADAAAAGRSGRCDRGISAAAACSPGIRSAQRHVGGDPGPRRHVQDVGARRLISSRSRKSGDRAGRDDGSDLDECDTTVEWVQTVWRFSAGAGTAKGTRQLCEPGVFSGAADSSGAGTDLGRCGKPAGRAVAVINETLAKMYSPRATRSGVR